MGKRRIIISRSQLDEMVTTFTTGSYTYDAPGFESMEGDDFWKPGLEHRKKGGAISVETLDESMDNNTVCENVGDDVIDEYFEKYGVTAVMDRFVDDMRAGRRTESWGVLINPAMYQKALQVFTQFGELEGRFPTDKIYQWLGTIIRNTIQLDSNTKIAGHDYGYPMDDIEESKLGDYIKEKWGLDVLSWSYDGVKLTCDMDYLIGMIGKDDEVVDGYIHGEKSADDVVKRFNEIKGEIETRNTIGTSSMEAMMLGNGEVRLEIGIDALLDDLGVFDWMEMPSGDIGWSDYGVKPLFDILADYDDMETTPEQALVMINKCLDVTHQNGDLASIFIEGGSSSLSSITNGSYLNEEHTPGTIKLYHNTNIKNLASIIRSGEMRTTEPHPEGHGDILWFTTQDDVPRECRVSMEIPLKYFGLGTFKFVNKNHVITDKDVEIDKFGMEVEAINYVKLDEFDAYVTFDKDRLERLVKNQPNDKLEEAIFKAFYKQYKDNNDMMTVLEYIWDGVMQGYDFLKQEPATSLAENNKSMDFKR